MTKLSTKINEYHVALKNNPTALEKATFEHDLWELYKENLQGKRIDIERRDWLREHCGGECVGYYDARAYLLLLLYDKTTKIVRPSIATLFKRIDQGELQPGSAAHLVRTAKKVATAYDSDLDKVLTLILDNYGGVVQNARKLDFTTLLAKPAVKAANNGKAFKRTVLELAEEYARVTHVVGPKDMFGQRLLKDFNTDLTVVVDAFIAKAGFHRREVKAATTVLVSREEFDWAAQTLSIDRKRMGDYGEDLRMDMIKKRFRQQVSTVHPDRNSSAAAAAAFKAFTEAMDVINNYTHARTKP